MPNQDGAADAVASRFELVRLAVVAVGVLALGAQSAKPPASPAPQPDLAKPAFDGNPGWLVIGEATTGAREAALKGGDGMAQGGPVAAVRSNLFRGLRKDLIVLVYGGFADRARATALAAELNGKGIKVYVKDSGALAAPEGSRPSLMRIWGRLDERVRFPTE